MTWDGQARVVFVSYAHKDVDLLDRLLVVLKPLVREGQVDMWVDRRIGVSKRWNDEIEAKLERAEVAVLLVSADFLASDYIMDVELPRLVDRDVPLVCVPAGSSPWKSVDALASVQWPLPPERPLRAMERDEQDSALVRVYEAVEEVAARLDFPYGDTTDGSRVPRPAGGLEPGAAGPLFGVPTLPAGYQARPPDLEALKERVRASADVGLVGRQGASGLHGQGGVGKSVLAAALGHDPEIRSWFPDGIYWVSVGETAELVGVQRQLARHVGVDLESSNPVDGLRELRRAFRGRRCLVVADDVWSTAAAEALRATSEEGRVLYTTRDPSVLAAVGASAQAVDVLDPAASLAFLERAAGTVAPDDRPVVERLAAQTGGVMLALSLAAAMARAGRGWADLAAGMEALAEVFRDHPYADVFKAMRLAVEGLDPADASCYRLLGVFPEDAAVPEATIARVWGVEDASPTLGRLVAADLLGWSEGRVTFHDLQRAFVIFDVTDPWALVHRHLLDTHRPPGGWAYLPDDEPYLWDHLFHHLQMAREHREMAAVATNGRWLARRVYRDGPYAAELDCVAAEAHEPTVAGVLAVLRRWAPLFGKGLSQAGVAATAVSRLPSAEHDATDLLGHEWLQPATALPEPPTALLRSLTGHTGWFQALAFAPDGHILASAGDDSTVRLWDHATGADVGCLTGHSGWVHALAFAPDGHILASAGDDSTVRLWDHASGAELHCLTGHVSVNAVAFAPDGETLATAGDDNTVRLWGVATGTEVRSLTGHTGRVHSVAFAPHGRILASAGGDGTVRFWDAETGSEVRACNAHNGRVRAVAYAPDGHTLASGGDDGTVRLWDARSGIELLSLTGHSSAVSTVAYAPDGRCLASADGQGTVRVWDARTGTELRSLRGHTGAVSAVAYAPDGRTLGSACDDATVRLWDATSGTDLRSEIGHTGAVSAVAYAPDGRTLASACDDGTVRLWDATSGSELRSAIGHTGAVSAVAYAPDGRTLASAGRDHSVRVWDATSLAELRIINDSGPASALAYAPDGRALASTGDKGTVRLWDVATGSRLRRLGGHADHMYAVAFAAVAVTPDGNTLASAGWDDTVRLWDPVTGSMLHSLAGHTGAVSALAFAPDGNTLASADIEGTVWLWGVHRRRRWKSSMKMTGHIGAVCAVVFAPDGHTLASAGDDGTVRLWDPATGAEVAALRLGEPVRAIDWSPDGTALAAGFGTTVTPLRLRSNG